VQSRHSVDADDIKAALDAAQAEAIKNHWDVSIAAVDDGGHLLGFLRLTGAAPLSARIAVGKARTAALSRRESKFYEEMVKNGRNAFLSVPDLTVLEGGVPVFVAGHCIAAIGVSGAKSDQDVQVAAAGVKALLARQQQP
jgi:uncharacterized protein GlcG (DUF336 family)